MTSLVASDSLSLMLYTVFFVLLLLRSLQQVVDTRRCTQVDAGTGKHHTYGDICRVVPRVSWGLRTAGVGAGDAVLVISPNHIDYPLVLLAVLLTPAVCVPVNPNLKPGKSIAIFLFLLSVCLPLFVCRSAWLCISVCPPLLVCLSASVGMSACLFLPICLCASVTLFVSVCL